MNIIHSNLGIFHHKNWFHGNYFCIVQVTRNPLICACRIREKDVDLNNNANQEKNMYTHLKHRGHWKKRKNKKQKNNWKTLNSWDEMRNPSENVANVNNNDLVFFRYFLKFLRSALGVGNTYPTLNANTNVASHFWNSFMLLWRSSVSDLKEDTYLDSYPNRLNELINWFTVGASFAEMIAFEAILHRCLLPSPR